MCLGEEGQRSFHGVRNDYKEAPGWVWWHISVIPAFGRLKQEDHEFEDSLGYIVRTCLLKKRNSEA
jgi:hypothetical protein